MNFTGQILKMTTQNAKPIQYFLNLNQDLININQLLGKKAAVSPATLAGLLDKVKSYALLAQYHPEVTEGIEYVRVNRVMIYPGFRVHLEEVWRFEREDTLVFRLALENTTGEPIQYKPQDLAVRVGNRIYCQAIADASGVMPPNAVVPAYFAITGNPAGGRNNLSADNRWNVLLPRIKEGS